MGSSLSRVQQPVAKCWLLDAPPEVLDMILEHCDHDTLYTLYLTCKQLHASITPRVKYRHIDISVHHDEPQPYKALGIDTPQHWPNQIPYLWDLHELAQKQQAFISRIIDQPVLGKYVRHLTWTIRDDLIPDHIHPIVSLDQCMWQVFEGMANVTHLDLACLVNSYHWRYLRNPPKSLFPSVIHLRLSGVMQREIVTTIMETINLAKLEFLFLDDLQDPGQEHGRNPGVIGYRRWSRTLLRGGFRVIPIVEDDQTTLPGPMRGILPLIEGKCTRLRTFHYRKPGIVHKGQYTRHQHLDDADQQCYVEVAAFICATAPTLQSFHFEQGVREEDIPYFLAGKPEQAYAEEFRPSHQTRKPMDTYVVKYIVPAIQQTHWEALRSLRITGVGTWNGRPGLVDSKIGRLKKHLGDDVAVLIEDVDDRPSSFYLGARLHDEWTSMG